MSTIHPVSDVLKDHPFFSGMSPEYLELIGGCARNVHFAAGDYLFREGLDADSFFVLRDGTVALDLHVPPSGVLTIETVEQGEIVGFSWIVPPYRWVYDGRVVTPVRATEINGICLRDKCAVDPRFGYEIMKRFASVMGDRLQAARLRLIDIYGKPGGEKPGKAG